MASYSHNAAISVIAGGATTAAIDFIGRLKSGEASPAVLHPDSGGHVWFIPIWIVGLIASICSVLAWLGKI